MKKSKTSKLVLDKTTVALLTTAALENVAGGMPNPTRSCWIKCPTIFATC